MISIHLKDGTQLISLTKGIYFVYLSGGWGFKNVPVFKISSADKVYQSLAKDVLISRIREKIDGIRCIRIAKITIPETGDYQLSVSYSNEVKVWKSMLYSVRWFQQPIPADELRLVFLRE